MGVNPFDAVALMEWLLALVLGPGSRDAVTLME